jgi:hypothetical protein
MKNRKLKIALGEEGSILMITLIMILLATIIGFIAIKTATTGISIAGNYKSGMQAFYTADSVNKYVVTEPTSFDLNRYNINTPLPAVAITDPGLPGTSILSSIFPAVTSNMNSSVTYLSTGLPPAGTSSKYFQTNYFLIKTNVKGTNKSQDALETLYASTVPKVCGQSC